MIRGRKFVFEECENLHFLVAKGRLQRNCCSAAVQWKNSRYQSLITEALISGAGFDCIFIGCNMSLTHKLYAAIFEVIRD